MRTKRGNKDDWQTPDEILEMIGPIDLDPCAGEDTSIGSEANWTEGGLSREWFGRVFVNPPFSNKTQWVKKCALEFTRPSVNRDQQLDCIILLTPDSMDPQWFHRFIAPHATSLWWSEGRINYIDPETKEQVSGVSFGTMLSIFGTPWSLDSYQKRGHIVTNGV